MKAGRAQKYSCFYPNILSPDGSKKRPHSEEVVSPAARQRKTNLGCIIDERDAMGKRKTGTTNVDLVTQGSGKFR